MSDKRDRRHRMHYAPVMRQCQISNQDRSALLATGVPEDVTCKRCLHYMLTETGRK